MQGTKGKATVCGHDVTTNENNLPCLTDLWIIAGRPAGKKPCRYKSLKRAKLIFAHAAWYTRRGHGTWSRLTIAIDYAEYLGLKPVQPSPSDAPDPSDTDSFWEDHARRKAANQERLDRELEEYKARLERELAEKMRRDQEEREQGFESYREYNPDRPEDDDNDINYGDDWMDPDVAADKDTASDPWQGDVDPEADPYGLDGLLFEFINIPGFLRIRCSVN